MARIKISPREAFPQWFAHPAPRGRPPGSQNGSSLRRIARGKACARGHDGHWLPQKAGFFCAKCRDERRAEKRALDRIALFQEASKIGR